MLLVTLMAFSLIQSFLVSATVIDGAPQNIISGANNNFVNLSNSGTYSVNFALSGTLDPGDTFGISAVDGS